MLPMVDLSNHTGAVTANDLKGTALIAAKCTELGPGITFVDGRYAGFRAMAKQIGARFMAYHYGHPGVSASESWAFFSQHAQLGVGDFFALDHEEGDGLTAAENAAWGSAFAHAGYGQFRAWPWVYSDRNFIAAGNLAGVTYCPLWVAIPTPDGSYPAGAPPIAGWVVTTAVQFFWGTLANKEVDRDVVYCSTLQQLDKLAIPAPPAGAGVAGQLAAAEQQLTIAQTALTALGGLLPKVAHV